MRKVIKAIFFAASTLSVIILSAVAILKTTVPDEFYVSEKGFTDKGIGYGLSITVADTDFVAASTGEGSNTTASVSFLKLFPVKLVEVTKQPRTYVVASGKPFGIKMYSDGVLVISIADVQTSDGIKSPGKDSGLQVGDIIKSINGSPVYKTEEVAKAIEKSDGAEIKLEVVREGKQLVLSLKPEKLKGQNVYKAGFWVRDSCAGIGTMTFYDIQTNCFAGLGHAVCDVDTGAILEIKSGEIVPATITGVYKGVSGSPGELCGIFSTDDAIGKIGINNETGVYGSMNTNVEGTEIPVAFKQEIEAGKAQILTTINGETPQYYDVEIVKINLNSSSVQKNMVIRITDERLIDSTGGIVQGMSGSPIIQNGMLVGAVTHVFINNPQQGYAIFAENMINTVQNLSQTQQQAA
ncbi:MAG: SpoIVB peptidase [Clostridia bacterium]|nr:SpoIVB peptidase [Clostridia bacterium]